MKHVSKNPYIYYDYIDGYFKLNTLRYLEEERLLHNFTWKEDILNHCKEYGISFSGIMNMKETMLDAIQKIYKDEMEISIDYKHAILNALKWAYNITDEQPIAISDKLKQKGAEYRLLYGKWSKGIKRDKVYWKFVSSAEYDVWLAKKKK